MWVQALTPLLSTCVDLSEFPTKFVQKGGDFGKMLRTVLLLWLSRLPISGILQERTLEWGAIAFSTEQCRAQRNAHQLCSMTTAAVNDNAFGTFF